MRAFTGPVSHFYWYWLPEYLKHGRGMSLAVIGMIAWVPYFCAVLGDILGGLFSSLLIRRGWQPIRARKAVSIVSVAFCLCATLVPAAHSPVSALILIGLAAFGIDSFSCNHMALLADLFPGTVLARVSGITGVGDNLMSMTAMLCTGIVVDHFSYLPVFMAAGLMPLLALASFLILVRRKPHPPAPESVESPVFCRP
jgi:ACS family hexuronate transporter-like MFS transporter